MKEFDNSLLLNEILESMGMVIEFDLNDYETHQHAIRVGEGCVIVGERLGLHPNDLQKLYYTGLLHDIGKITVPLEILHKTSQLSEEEYDVVKGHTVSGSRIIAALPGMTGLASWVRWHHEWWDGSGYPDGLKGDEIPLPVQIMSILDMFDSMQSPRPDRSPIRKAKAVETIKNMSGTQFNPEVAKCILDLIDEGLIDAGEHASNHFAELRDKYVNVPFKDYDIRFWQNSGISGFYSVLKLFANVIDSKHTYTTGHSTRVATLSKILCEKMKLSHEEIVKVEIAGLLHDAGKIMIPIEILDKKDKLTEEEWAIIKSHTSKTFEIIGYSSTLREIAFIAACHHERYDGKGYPMRLGKDEIPLLSQVISVADTFDAITSARSYHPERTAEYAYSILQEVSGTQLNPELVEELTSIPPHQIAGLIDMHAS